MTDSELRANDILEVGVLHLGPHDALIFRYPGTLSEAALSRFRTTVEGWSERTFGRKVPCLVLEEGASVEVLRDAAVVTVAGAMPDDAVAEIFTRRDGEPTMTAELLDDGRTVLIDGVRIAVELIADALITSAPRRQVIRADSEDGSHTAMAIESYRKDDIVYYRSTCHLLETDGDKVLQFLGLSDLSREEF